MMPAAIEKLPNVVNIEMNVAPCSSARFRPSRFNGWTSRPSGVIIACSELTTASVWPTPVVSPPRFEISIWLTIPGRTDRSLRRGEREDACRTSRAGTRYVDDVGDDETHEGRPGEHDDRVACAGRLTPSGRGAIRHSTDPGASAPMSTGRPPLPVIGAEAGEAGGVGREQRHRRLGLARRCGPGRRRLGRWPARLRRRASAAAQAPRRRRSTRSG